MKRETLIELVRAAAVRLGYAFHTGEEHTVGGSVRAYPAAWLVPPEVKEHTGRREGETTFRVTLHLMALPAGAEQVGGEGGETVWQALECDALAVAREIAESDAVCAVSNVRCIPARGSLTAHGESSVSLVCDMKLWYSI